MAKESLTFNELIDSSNRLGQAANNLDDLQNEFRSITNEIGEAGSELGGDLGNYVKGAIEQEINVKLTRLTNYVNELKKQVAQVASTNEEEANKATQLIDEIKG